MKKLFVLSLFCCLFVSCDKVDKPLVNYVPPVEPRRKVLLEDYTGHQCGNCPRAAEVIHDLEGKYHDELVVISVHAGGFAATNSKYPTSYTTTTGNDWNMHFLGLAAAYPSGSVNRTEYDGHVMQSSTSKWSSIVDQGFKEEYILDLSISPAFSFEGRTLNVSVKGKFKTSYSKNLNISVVLTEDSIIGPQVDYSKGPQPEYLFMHMLRDAVNGSWGTPFTTSAMAKNDSITVSFKNFVVNEKFKAGNMSVVAFAFDPETRVVVEAEKVSMTGKASN